MSASRTLAVGAGPGEHTAVARRGGSWRWLGRRGSLARRLLLSYGVVVLVDVAVFVSTDLYMTARLDGTSRDSGYRDELLANQLGAVATAALISLIVGAVAAVLLPRLLLDPLRQLRHSTRSLMEGRYTDSVPEPRLPELSDLAQDVNVLAARLADLEVRRARLVSDVAHELRTPLTIIDGQLAGVEDGVYSLDSDLIASIREELDRLHRLTDDLSGLSRAEESAYKLHRAQTDLAGLYAQRSIARGEGSIGGAWATGMPALNDDLAHDGSIAAVGARAAGLSRMVVLPVIGNARLEAMLAWYL